MKTHRFDPNLSIKCGINSCSERYKNYESFRSHVYRKHKEVINPARVTRISENQETGSEATVDNATTDIDQSLNTDNESMVDDE